MTFDPLAIRTVACGFWLATVLLPATTLGQYTACASRQNQELKIVAFGDSTTVGYSLSEGYPTKLLRRLAALGISASIINAGVNGDTTSGGRERLADDVLQHRPDLVLIQFGLNDQTIRLYESPETTKTYVTAEDFAENLRYFARALHAAGSRVILMTPNPMVWTDKLEFHYPAGPYLDGPRGGNKLLRRYAEAVRIVAAEEGADLVDILRVFDEYQESAGHNLNDFFLDDGVHPNDSGYELIAKTIAATIARTPPVRHCVNNQAGNCLALLRDEYMGRRLLHCCFRRKVPCVTTWKIAWKRRQ